MTIYDIINKRRTVRRFKQNPIDRDCVLRMIDSARLSPSAGNLQPLKYTIIDSLTEREKIYPYIKYAGYIDDWKPEFFESPVSFIAVLKDNAINTNDLTVQCDCGIAMMSILLTGIEMGIDSCILGSIDRKRISEIIGLDQKYKILYLIGIGQSNQKNTQYDCDETVKYTMDSCFNFFVPKRKLDNIIIDRKQDY